MNGPDVCDVLLAKGIQHLYHANSVVTSDTFLRQGGLVSRGTAEENRWSQTEQYTDDTDKRYGVWRDIFLDSDDYHRRINNRNQYGPVVFVMESTILNGLPAGSAVYVTRSNPTKWSDGQNQDDRYYSTTGQLRAELMLGTFDQMVTIRIPGGILPFGQHLLEVILDNPAALRLDGTDAFSGSLTQLTTAAKHGHVKSPIRERSCNLGCKCVHTYKGRWNKFQDHF